MALNAPRKPEDSVLAELLDRASGFAPEYAHGLSNHLSMALVALSRLGATNERLEKFYSRYSTRLQTNPPSDGSARDTASPDSWHLHLGDIGAYSDLQRSFHRELDIHGVDQVLRRALPILIPGIGAAAFHGLIRTAYGVERKHIGETASGLAYWACRYLVLYAELPEPGELACAPWLNQIAAEFQSWEPGDGLIHEDMLSVASLPQMQSRLNGLQLTSTTLEELTRFAAKQFADTRNFTTLHLITSAHAIRVLLQYCNHEKEAVHWYALAFATGLATVASIPPTGADQQEAMPWPEILDRAARSDNDHVIKLVYSCSELSGLYPGDEFRLAASTQVS